VRSHYKPTLGNGFKQPDYSSIDEISQNNNYITTYCGLGRNIFCDNGEIRLKRVGSYILKVSRYITRLTSTSRMGTETDIDNIRSRTREEAEGLYEMAVAMTNELKV